VKGAVKIDPAQSGFVAAPAVLIESLKRDGNTQALGSDIVIPAGRGKLEIDYTSCALRSPDRVTFRYKLEGFDNDWISAPKRRSAVYANLPPGRYRFRVFARDGAFPESLSEASLPFRWLPFFWETLWFRISAAIVLGLLIWISFFLYSRQTRARYSLVLAERTRLAREMHDTVLQGCVGVSTLLEAASMIPQSQSELIQHARSQIRLTIDEAREALWDLRNPALDRDFTGLLRSFAQGISKASGIPVRAEITGEPATVDEHVVRSLLLVAREAIRNAVAHAAPAQVIVKLDFKPGAVTLEVSDDGHGFVPESAERDGHYGILGMRERAEQLGGTFHVESAPGHGTTVRAVVPLHEDGSKERTGAFRQDPRAGGR
jgi:two-component sensor histidine kinase